MRITCSKGPRVFSETDWEYLLTRTGESTVHKEEIPVRRIT